MIFIEYQKIVSQKEVCPKFAPKIFVSYMYLSEKKKKAL
ncbi:hypothetical protein SK637_00322 [Streptococcus mitis]|nr:hypothetical protein SK637_00322 [Streptococcus mitis]